MDEKSLKAIERIMAICNELNILTYGKNADYFYERLEMNILINLVEEADKNIKNISLGLKEKYKDIEWDLIDKARYYDEVFGASMKVSKAWELSSSLYDVFYDKLNDILCSELSAFYHDVCVKKHEEIKKLRDKK